MDANRVKQKYEGEAALKYDERREGTAKWQNEQDAVELLLRKVLGEHDGITLLDIPVGTGRFFDLYAELSVDVVGMDVSEDMIAEAMKKRSTSMENISLQRGDILKPEKIDVRPDVLVCIRLMHWFDFDEVRQTLKSIKTLDPDYFIIGLRHFPQQDTPFIESIVRKSYRFMRCTLEPLVTDDASRNVHLESKWNRELSRNDYIVENRVLVAQSITGSQYYIYLIKNESGQACN